MTPASVIYRTIGSSWLIQACTLLQSIVLARWLGPEGRGEYAAIVLWPTFLATMCLLGTGNTLARWASSASGTPPKEGFALRVGLVTGLGALLLSILCTPYLLSNEPKHVVEGALIFSLFVLPYHVTCAFIAVDQGRGDFMRFNITRALSYPIQLGITALLLVAGVREVGAYTAAFLLSVVVVAGFCVANRFRAWRQSADLRVLSFLRESIRFWPAEAVSALLQSTDKALVLWISGAANLGLYTAAYSSASVIAVATQAIGQIAFRVSAVASRTGGLEPVARLFRQALWISAICGVVLALTLPLLVPLVFGDQFKAAIGPSIALVPGFAFAGLAFLLEQSFRGRNIPYVGVLAKLVLAVAFALGASIAESKLGLVGISILWSISQGALLLYFIYACRRVYTDASLSLLVPSIVDLTALANRTRP